MPAGGAEAKCCRYPAVQFKDIWVSHLYQRVLKRAWAEPGNGLSGDPSGMFHAPSYHALVHQFRKEQVPSPLAPSLVVLCC